VRVRFNPKAEEQLQNEKRYIENKDKIQEIINSCENKNRKIYLEVGMGKGDFISKLASINKDDIYIGVEVSKPVLALAIKKINRFEIENNISLNNLYLMSFDAKDLSSIFHENQIEKLYLNFSDPWPKKKHTKRRLTYKDFLEEYKKILKNDGIIEFKTDNRILFEYSLVSMQNYGMEFLEVYLDLHKTDIENIVTEYEEKFSPKGPIYKLVAKMK